jgi:lysozyme
MRTSEVGIALIESFEGCRLTAYLDIVGVPTVGFGHTGQDVYLGMRPISMAQADQFLRQDLSRTESYIMSVVTGYYNQAMFDAMVCMTYNIGTGNFAKSSVLKLLNLGDNLNAADAFMLWNKAGGIVQPGLTRRRQAERALFLQGVSSLTSTPVAALPVPPIPPVDVPPEPVAAPVEAVATPDPTPVPVATPDVLDTDLQNAQTAIADATNAAPAAQEPAPTIDPSADQSAV